MRQESAHLKRIEGIIEERLQKMLEKRPELKSQVITARKEMWDDNRHVIRDFDDVILLSAQDREVADREKRYGQNEEEIRRLLKMRQSPYFARLDFEEGSRGACTVYIGVHSLKGEGAFELHVVDWRAPVSSMFYDHDLGAGWYEVLGRRIPVQITLKRQFKIEDGRLLLMYDTDSAMFDDILGSVLSQNTDSKLKVIIGSIQKEQNVAIRSDTKRSCLIYGLAGSGKTSVGLHRLAYILYHNRDTIKSENILILSNNRIFSAYISTILPDLGERAAESLIFQELLAASVGKKYQIEDYYEQLREIETHPDGERVKWLRVKYSFDFLEYCTRYFSGFSFRVPGIRYHDREILSQTRFREIWGTRHFSSFRAGFEMASELIQKSIEDFFALHREEIRRDIANASKEFLTDREIAAIYQKKKKRYLTTAQAEFLRLNRLEPELQLVRLLRAYLQSIGEETYEADRLHRAFLRGRLFYEDALLYLLVSTLMGETSPFPNIRHIVIDEAQDYNPIQILLVKRLFPKSSFTILADIHQAVNSVTTIRDYAVYERIFGADLLKICLNKCYRSSAEISALAFRLLPASGEYTYFERSVQKPQYILCADVQSCIEPILEELKQYNTVAIITNREADAITVKASLTGHEEAQLLISPEDRIQSRLVILPLLLAKGLEFDAVILISSFSANAEDPQLRRKVYLGCTRALHALYLVENTLPPVAEKYLPYLELRHM